MGDNKKLVQTYELKQKALKKENKRYKKKIPYYIFGFIFFALGLITLLDGRINNFVGNSYNLIVAIITILGFISITYLIIVFRKIKKNNAEIKALGLKSYKIMKL